MPFTENAGVRLHWQAQGQGTPLLLVMGHRYSSELWYPALPALSAEHRLVRFDNRGTGQSDAPRKISIQDMARDAFAVMDAAGLARAHVFGVSMGGGIVQEMALQQPERIVSMVLGCTAIFSAEKPRMPAFVRALYYLPPGVLKLLMSSRRPGQGYGSAASSERIAADQAVLAMDRFSVPGVVAQAAAIAAYTPTKDAIAQLRMPALVLHGDEDAVVRFAWGEELAQTLPNSRFVRLEGAGHNFMVARPEAANRAVLDFLRDVDSGALA